MSQKKIVVCGVTGSIGESTLRIVEAFDDRFEIIGVGAGKNIKKLNSILKKHRGIEQVSIFDESDLKDVEFDGKIGAGEEALLSLLDLNPDLVVVAVAGKAGWKLTLRALEMGIPVALANKESLLIAGFYMGREVTTDRSRIVPVDSEHAAIMQLVENAKLERVDKLYITASGGALRSMEKEEAWQADAEKALDHPVWDMGQKVTVDSATMLNKGMELIEAYFLFPFEPDQLDAIVHPEVGVHAALGFVDGSMTAQMSVSDMALPIAGALAYPQMLPLKERMEGMDYTLSGKSLNFEKPDLEKYPLLALAFELLKKKDYSAMVAYAVADEVAVNAFLKGEIRIGELQKIVIDTVSDFRGMERPESVEGIEKLIEEIEKRAENILAEV